MYLQSITALCSAVLLALPNIGIAKEISLPSSSKWLMDYSPDSCQLVRSFGNGEDQTIVQFASYNPEPRFDLTITGNPIGSQAERPSVRLRFGTSAPFVRTDAMLGRAGNKPVLFLSGRLDNLDLSKLQIDEYVKLTPAEQARLNTIDPAAEAAVQSMTLIAGSRTLVLELGSMGPPMAAMRKCLDALISDWGLDAKEQANLISRPVPKGNPGTWLTSSDYPGDSLARGEQAIIRFRIMVDAAGTTTACSVQSAIAKGDFAQITCNLLKRRARFEPARNARNESVASYFVGKVFWVMP